MPSIRHMSDVIVTRLEQKTRAVSQSSALYQETMSQLTTAELVIARARSLHLKFACDGENKNNEGVKTFVLNLMQQEEVKVIGASRGPVGKVIHKMFSDAKVSRILTTATMLTSSHNFSLTALAIDL